MSGQLAKCVFSLRKIVPLRLSAFDSIRILGRLVEKFKGVLLWLNKIKNKQNMHAAMLRSSPTVEACDATNAEWLFNGWVNKIMTHLT